MANNSNPRLEKNRSESSSSAVRHIEEQVQEETFAEKFRSWCSCQLLNLLYIGIVVGIFAISQAIGQPWIGQLLQYVIIAVGIGFGVGLIYYAYFKRVRASSAESPDEETSNSAVRPSTEGKMMETVHSLPAEMFHYTSLEADETRRFGYRWELVIYQWLFGLVWIFFAGVMMFLHITWPALRTPQVFNLGWWFAVTIGLLFQAISFFVMPRVLGNALAQVTTKYTPEEIQRPSLYGLRRLAWSEVVRAEISNLKGGVIWLYSPTQTLCIDLQYFRKPRTALEEIKKRLLVSLEASHRHTILY